MTYQQSDFALDFCGAWREGGYPAVKPPTKIMVVSHDARHSAYNVGINQMDNFYLWVAAQWVGDNDPEYRGGDVGDFLDEIGVRVWEFA